eukprot:259997-Rhodomonas_salina.1
MSSVDDWLSTLRLVRAPEGGPGPANLNLKEWRGTLPAVSPGRHLLMFLVNDEPFCSKELAVSKG